MWNTLIIIADYTHPTVSNALTFSNDKSLMIAVSDPDLRMRPSDSTARGMGTVVLVHGLSASRLFMEPLARRLRREGFKTLNWGYRSSRYSCEHHARNLANLAVELEGGSPKSPLHFVGHSMGSIVIRAALEMVRPQEMGRVVMLAPPNQGSHVARRVGPLIKWVCPTMVELSDVQKSYVNQLPLPQGYEFGVIAAGMDWVIKQDCTVLPGLTDFSVVLCNHGFIPWHPQAISKSLRFLNHGHF